MHKLNLLRTIKQYNQQSELYLAQQEKDQRNGSFNYAEDFGTFGFLTTKSEREVFMHRKEGLIRAIRLAFEKVTAAVHSCVPTYNSCIHCTAYGFLC